MTNLKKVKYHTIGTNPNSYFKRFREKYEGMDYFIVNHLEDEREILAIKNGDKTIVIDKFTSQSTLGQFLKSLLAYGLIKKGKNKYEILNFDEGKIWETIFIKDQDAKINTIRQNRIISLLTAINYINEDNFESLGITGVRGKTKLKNIKKEISNLEINLIQNFEELINILERIRIYEFEN